MNAISKNDSWSSVGELACSSR